MGRESTVWPETWSRSMPGPFRSLWDGSNPLRGAVPGLVLEVQVGSTMSVQAQIIENDPNWVHNRPFGLKLGPEACQDRSGAFGMGLTHSEGPSPAWSWRSKSGPQCRFGPKSSKMARNGSRIDGLARNKDQMNPTTCPDPSGPLLRPKTAKKPTF